MSDLSTFSPGMLAFLGVLVVIELGLMIAAVVSIVRLPGPLAGEKLVWLLLSLFVNMIGPLLYFAVGKKRLLAALPAQEAGAAPSAEAARGAVDALYGDQQAPPPADPAE